MISSPGTGKGGAQSAATPITYTRETCPDRRKHTACPAGYVEWHEWAERKARTHRQKACPTCSLFVIWVRKTQRKRRA